MSHSNFIARVPSIPARPIPRSKRSKKKIHASNLGSCVEMDAIDKPNYEETRNSSYYSLQSSESSESKLKILETYDEFLSLKDLDNVFWKASDHAFRRDQSSTEGIFLLKQICADLNLEIAVSEKNSEINSLLQTEHLKIPQCDMRTIIVQRFIDTQEQIASFRKNSRTGFSRETLKRDPLSKSSKSLGTIEELPSANSVLIQTLSKTLSNLTSKYIAKQKAHTCESEVQVNLLGPEGPAVRQSCITQTDVKGNEVNDIAYNFKEVASQMVQARSKHRDQHVQSSLVECENKYSNTKNSSFYPNQTQFTQMYEHITENDLFCMEWIDKNLFRVPVNPNTIVVDEKLKESSELTCLGTNFFEQELSWERQALFL